MKWRFLPLQETPRFGILVNPDGEPIPARFLTVKQAKDSAHTFKNSAWRKAA